MAAKSFDDVSQTIIFDSDIYDVETETWKRKPNGNKGSKPSYLETHKEFINNVLRIEQDKNTGLIYISVEHLSPFFAKELLSLIMKLTLLKGKTTSILQIMQSHIFQKSFPKLLLQK